MGQFPLVSIIVVNWNGLDTIEKCIESLLAQSYPKCEIVVVDNHSEDGSREKINALYGKKAVIILNEQNEGFAGGNNQGIKASKGAYIALLNNDAWADQDWIFSLVKTALKDSRIGMCASKIYLAGGNNLIDNTGHLIYPDGLSWGRGRLEKDDGQFNKEEEVIFPSGCAALYKKEMLDEIGLFDQRFFAYCEDTDLGLRGRLFGWRAVYSPRAVVYHHFSGSTSRASKMKAFLVERNRGWVVVKNFPFIDLMKSPWFTLKRLSCQTCGAVTGQGLAGEYLRQNSFFSGLVILLKAWFYMVLGVPGMLKDRKDLFKKKKVSSKEIGVLLEKYRVSARVIAFGKTRD
ncbi:MAG: glycosyltransferase family 2 protein [Nitrospirae bacterium]|nr:glycosyltransferase family 2 protein [Nitrospirota bacterium]MBI3352467.1 glycosyltransferase family 2 protein [Nitrospirota bacterium]